MAAAGLGTEYSLALIQTLVEKKLRSTGFFWLRERQI